MSVLSRKRVDEDKFRRPITIIDRQYFMHFTFVLDIMYFVLYIAELIQP